MNPIDFYQKEPLYRKIDLCDVNEESVNQLIYFKGPLDLFCLWCNDTSVFNTNEAQVTDSGPNMFSGHRNIIKGLQEKEITGDFSGLIVNKEKFNYANKFYFKEFFCSRNNEHIFYVSFLIQDNKLFKIGQYPSELDLVQKYYYKYKKIIDQKILNEIRTSFILHSHNFNVASLIHLRRVFEFIMEENHQKKIGTPGWDDNKYLNEKTDDKIEMLKDVLPKKLCENKSAYGILSLGVHQLEDLDCKEAFDVLYPIFIMILEELKYEREQVLKEKELIKKKLDFETKMKGKI